VTQPGAQPLPAPDNFPVRWPNPDDVHTFWLVERMHWPDPMTPMDFDINRYAHEQFSWAFASYGVPLQYNARHINYRWYYAVTPSVADLSEMPARMQAGLQNLEATIPRLRELWDQEWLPEVLQHLEFWQSFDRARASMPELLNHLDQTVERHNRVWQLHFLQTLPVYMAMSTFDDLYQDLFSTDNALEAYGLMQGFDNKTLEMGRAVWRLSRVVLASPVLRAAVESVPVEQVVPQLERSEEGRAFLAQLAAYLESYGKRGEKLGVSFVSWIEDPSQVIRQLQEYLNQPALDPEAELVALAAERERLLAEARAKLAGYPQPVIAQFEAMLGYAQQATIISEDHTLYIDFGCMYEVRNVLLEFGRRFVAAVILERTDDVFLLTLSELRQAAKQEPRLMLQATVAARRAEMEHFRGITPPPALGTPPPGPMPDDPLSRTVGKFFGAPPAPPEGPPEALLLRGGAGSAGRTRGIARVIATLEDARRLQKGDILVAETTAPSWTPLFATAAAVVTDTGGVLSHSAVVAREYRIPAVVGVGLATLLIQDGQQIEVDGDRGVVRIIQDN
jgi:phosphohistidine swiveling domain-containing protein